MNCNCCEIELTAENWLPSTRANGSYRCRQCVSLYERARYQRNREAVIKRTTAANKIRKKRDPAIFLLTWAKQRAKSKGLECSISSVDIVIPEKCPVLGIPLAPSLGMASDASPSLDRIDPSKGYIPGNVTVISRRANTIKSDVTREELQLLISWLEKEFSNK